MVLIHLDLSDSKTHNTCCELVDLLFKTCSPVKIRPANC